MMEYIDYYLCAQDEKSLLSAIPESIQGAIDIIGITYRDDTPEGDTPIARNGYLANLRLPVGVAVPASLQPFLIDAPKNPTRVWA